MLTKPTDVSAVFFGHAEADLAQPTSLTTLVREHRPDLIINAGAYTAVDKAESEENLAYLINAEGPGALGSACAELGIPLIHYSTDYVFPGTGIAPWRENDPISPLSVYGMSKAEGELRIRSSGANHLIFRTSWVYFHEGKNFVKTMLQLGVSRDKLKVVSDQIGAPTSAIEIAKATWSATHRALVPGFDEWGTYHLAAQGETSWHQFALAIFEEAKALGYSLSVRSVEPIPTEAYPTPARRPLNSRLDTTKLERVFGVRLPHWRESLRECMVKLSESQAPRE